MTFAPIDRCCVRVSAAVAFLAPCIPALPTMAGPIVPPALQGASEVRLTDTVTLPIVTVYEFPFIEAEVAGIKGRLVLDRTSVALRRAVFGLIGGRWPNVERRTYGCAVWTLLEQGCGIRDGVIRLGIKLS